MYGIWDTIVFDITNSPATFPNNSFSPFFNSAALQLKESNRSLFANPAFSSVATGIFARMASIIEASLTASDSCVFSIIIITFFGQKA